MNKIVLNKEQIYEYQKNRDPYLFVDYATEIVPGESAKGYKELTKDEWFFKVHWPNDPNMPGMLQIESLVQLCALSILTLPGNRGKIMYLVSANNIKFIKKIVPNTKLIMETEVKSFNRGLAICTGVGIINNEIACKADFNLILPDLIKTYNLKS